MVKATSGALTQPGKMTPIAGSEYGLDVSSAASLTVPTNAHAALIQALTQNVRWRDDGVAPDSTTGMQLIAGNDILYVGDLSALQIIEEAATAIVNVAYYRSD